MLTKLGLYESLESSPAETPLALRQRRRPVKLEPAPLMLAPSTPAQRLYEPLRRLLDFTCACLIGVFALPCVVLAALAIKLTSRGPAFYTQVRVGRGGKLFTIYKIRSMIHNCESLTGPRWTMPGDPRVTPIGWFLRRTHLDELPQLLNVLAGEMSLIGPRPERPEFVAELEPAIAGYALRHEVLPGITGLAQVQLDPDTDVESVRRKVQYDLYFIQHLSLWLDLRILAATVLHMAGISFSLLRQLRIIPGVHQVESSAPVRLVEEQPHFHQQAA